MEMKFCHRCGAPLEPSNGNAYHCSNGHTIFDNPCPAVGVFFVTDDNQVILSVRGIEPHKGMLDALGGFVEQEETFQEAAVRELREELGLEPKEYEELRYVTSAVGHYPYKGEVHPLVCTLFWSRLKTDRELTVADDVAAIRTLPLKDLDLTLLHDDDIRAGIVALRQLLA